MTVDLNDLCDYLVQELRSEHPQRRLMAAEALWVADAHDRVEQLREAAELEWNTEVRDYMVYCADLMARPNSRSQQKRIAEQNGEPMPGVDVPFTPIGKERG